MEVFHVFSLFDRVMILETGVIGTIIDKSTRNGKTWYIVESDKEGAAKGGYGDKWPLFDCTADELQAL